MADGDALSMQRGAEEGLQPGRLDRPALIAFVDDAATETALREGLADAVPGQVDVRRGGIKAAIAALRKSETPRVLIVDISGADQPIAALHELSLVSEPDVRLLVVGKLSSLDFYREITRGMGALEYLTKPLTRAIVVRHFAPLAAGRDAGLDTGQGGRVLTVTGVRGGVGATTIAVNLAHHFGVTAARHTVLLDPDLHMGTAALMLDCAASPGLRTALETPDRVDGLFVDRAAHPVAGRLHVMAGEAKLAERPGYVPDAARKLLGALTARYNFVVADVPFRPHALFRDLLELSHQRVLVMEPTLACVRDALRLLALPAGPAQQGKPLIVLNRLGQPGGLPRRRIEDALKTRIDVVIPDLPRAAEQAATMGEPVTKSRNGIRKGVVELARLTGALRMFDGADGAAQAEARKRWRLFRRG